MRSRAARVRIPIFDFWISSLAILRPVHVTGLLFGRLAQDELGVI
jgi:hypothetical protein